MRNVLFIFLYQISIFIYLLARFYIFLNIFLHIKCNVLVGFRGVSTVFYPS